MPTPSHGTALTGPITLNDGILTVFLSGLQLTGPYGEVFVTFAFPPLGKPIIATGPAGGAAVLPATAFTYRPAGWDEAGLQTMLARVIEDRVGLRATGDYGQGAALRVGAREKTHAAASGVQATWGLPTTAALTERVLYDICVKQDDGTWYCVTPHAIYYRAAWTDFGIVHVTDIHVARRIDGFHEKLTAAGKTEGAARLYNWNDRFRGFIRYANFLHREGLIDVIMATGDIIDYVSEKQSGGPNTNNAEFARQLILGQAPGPQFPDVEELRVPIFMTGGNHDYRMYPYDLTFEAQIYTIDAKHVTNYSGYALREDEAEVLAGGRPSRNEDQLRLQVLVDPENPSFGMYLTPDRSYVVQLGAHRLLMIDSRYDTGVVTGEEDAIRVKAGWGGEDKQTFMAGTPNSLGPDAAALKLATDTIATAPADGLVIVGIHAPILNPSGNDYPPFLRETQRPDNPGQVDGFLASRPKSGGGPADMRAKHPSWYPLERDHPQPTYVKRGNTADLMDFGVSRSYGPALLKKIAGDDLPRKADVVLSGHIHAFNEFRVAIEDGEMRLYNDFYTDNPPSYYPTAFYPDGRVPKKLTAYVDIEPGAPNAVLPLGVPYPGAAHDYVVAIPPYADPLATTSDPAGWWNAHRPLVLQTSALGPRDDASVPFSGFRVLVVRNNVIDKIHFIPTDRLHQAGYVMPWDQAIRQDRPAPRTVQRVARSAESGAPLGNLSPVGYLAPNQSQNVVYSTSDELHEVWRDANGVPGHSSIMAADAPKPAGQPFVYLEPPAAQQIVLYRGADSRIHSLYWTTGAVGHDKLSESAGAPNAAGDPVGNYNPVTGEHHVFYRTADGHLHELWWQGTSAVGHGDLHEGVTAPAAVGTPSAFIEGGNVNVVCYRAQNNEIHSLYWTGAVGHDNLSGSAGAPLAAGDPFAYYTAHDDTRQIYYCAQNGHVIELYWAGQAGVSSRDLTAAVQAPVAAQYELFAYYDGTNKTKYVIYASPAGLIELSHPDGSGQWAVRNLSEVANAPLPASGASAWSDAHARHIFYLAPDRQVVELYAPHPRFTTTVHSVMSGVFNRNMVRNH